MALNSTLGLFFVNPNAPDSSGPDPDSLLPNPTPGKGETEVEDGVVENAIAKRCVVA